MSANSLKMSNYLYSLLSLKISEKGLLIRGSLVQAHPEALNKRLKNQGVTSNRNSFFIHADAGFGAENLTSLTIIGLNLLN